MDDKTAEKSRNLWYGIICAILGLLVGLPASYLFQADSDQHGIGNYLSKLGEFFTNRNMGLIAMATMASLALTGFLFGLVVSGFMSGLKELKSKPSSKSSPK